MMINPKTGILGAMTVLLILLRLTAAAEIPKVMSFQGRLTDAQSNQLTGNYDFIFTLYDLEQGGNSEWQENQYGVKVNNGLYSVDLGAVTPLNLSFSGDYWLDVQVKPALVSSYETLRPRVRLASTPYAFRSEYANRVGSATYADMLSGRPGIDYITTDSLYWLSLTTGGVTGLHFHAAADLQDAAITPAKVAPGSYEHIRAGTATVADALSQGTYNLGKSTFTLYLLNVSSLTAGKYYGDGSHLSGVGTGDMKTADYDENANNVVDDAERLNGSAYAHFVTTSTAQHIGGQKTFTGTVNPGADLAVGGDGYSVTFASNVVVSGLIRGTTIEVDAIRRPSGIMVLLDASESDAEGGSSMANVKTFSVPQNSFRYVMAESEVEFASAGVSDSSCSFRLKYGGNVKEDLTLQSRGNHAGDAHSMAGVLKYTEQFSGGSISVDTAVSAGNSGTWKIKSLRVYGIY